MPISNWNKQFHKCVKCSFWLLVITHHRPASIIYIINIWITTKLLVWPLLLYIRPSLCNFGFPRDGYYIVITTSYGSGYRFKANICSISKNVINTCGRFNSCAVFNYPGRLTDNLIQVAGTGYSFAFFSWVGRLMIASQYLNHPENILLWWYHILSQAFHTYYCHARVLLVFLVCFIILVRSGGDMGLLCGVFCLVFFVGIVIVI